MATISRVLLLALALTGHPATSANPLELVLGTWTAQQCAGVYRAVVGGAPAKSYLPPPSVSAAFRERAAGLWNQPYEERELQMFRVQPAIDMGAESEDRMMVRYRDKPVGKYLVRMNGDTMRFDIDIERNYKRTGLYEAMLARALLDNPRTRFIPARMDFNGSENVEAFSSAVFPSAGHFRGTTARGVDAATLKELRDKVIAAMYEMPAMKARERNGFGKLRKVILNPEKQEVAFVVEKGGRLKEEEIEFYIDEDARPTAISPAGGTRPADPFVRSLGAYAEAK